MNKKLNPVDNKVRGVLKVLVCVLFASWSVETEAVVSLPAVIGDNMVLQRGQSVPVWGWADNGEKVTVTICDQTRSVKTGKNGKWMIHFDPLKVGGPYTMTVQGGNKIIVNNIFVGDVWICSGQSNMELTVSECDNAAEEIAAADHPDIHLLSVPFKGTKVPQTDFKAQWVLCTPKTIGRFSAAGYYFGLYLKQNIDVPIGLINCSWGASSCESWMRRSVLESYPEYKPMLKEWDEKMANFDLNKADEAEQQYRLWSDKVAEAKAAGKEPPVPLSNADELLTLMFVVRRCPSDCYNGMLSPLIPFGIRGVIWYQGETNVDRAYQYRQLFPRMISSWRDEWAQGNFPFIFVQLANCRAYTEQPGQSDWAELREAQALALRTPNTGMAVTIDIGGPMIHPTNKQDVGKRLALWALANVYGKDVVYSGPVYKSMEKKGNKIVLHFDQMGTGLMSGGGEPLKGFAIAGTDQKFVWADACIANDMVIVSSPDVPDPISVRYAWANNPICNLYNREGLPASPFRTDSWKGITEK